MSPPSEATAVHLPKSALTTLSHRCAGIGAAGVEALREAGYRAGSDVLAALGESAGDVRYEEFLSRLDTALRRAGLGSVAYEPVSPSIGAVFWRGSVEAGGSRTDGASCHFAAGLLAGVLSRTAGRTVDVVEARCGGGGARPCWFLFGSVETLRSIRPRLSEVREAVDRGPQEAVGR
ncbi:MAG: hypothetical protein MJB57_11940 [Gemmatimonadetes bacterium]|nr:hypothetical protein [Gemmatimonadota bacterium]